MSKRRADVLHLLFVQLLLLVGGVAAFAGFAQAVAFDGLGEDDGGLALVFDGALVGVVDLLRIVAAAAQAAEFLVAHVLDQLEQLGILAEEFLADVGAALGLEALVFAVHALVHALEQQAGLYRGRTDRPRNRPRGP